MARYMDFASILAKVDGYFRSQLDQGLSINQITDNLKSGALPWELMELVDTTSVRRAGQIVATRYLQRQATEKSRATGFMNL